MRPGRARIEHLRHDYPRIQQERGSRVPDRRPSIQIHPRSDKWMPADDQARVVADEVDRLDLSVRTGTYAWFGTAARNLRPFRPAPFDDPPWAHTPDSKFIWGWVPIGCPHRGGDAWRHEPVAVSADSRAGQREAEQQPRVWGKRSRGCRRTPVVPTRPVWKA